MNRFLIALVLTVPIAPDGTEVQIDLPVSQQIKNIGSDIPPHRGMCVTTSITQSARWANNPVLQDFVTYAKQFPGGGYPEKVDELMRKIAQARNVPVPQYKQIKGGRETLTTLKLALKNGLCPSVTFGFSPSGRYQGQKISHMVNLLHLDEKYACVLDNNFPGTYEWMSVDEFYASYTSAAGYGWAVILLDAGPPPIPWN